MAKISYDICLLKNEQLASGKYALKMRVTIDRVSIPISLGQRIDVDFKNMG